MRRMWLGKRLYADLGDDGRWKCAEKRLERHLNRMSAMEQETIGPANGNPLMVLFHRIAAGFKPVKVELTKDPRDEGLVY